MAYLLAMVQMGSLFFGWMELKIIPLIVRDLDDEQMLRSGVQPKKGQEEIRLVPVTSSGTGSRSFIQTYPPDVGRWRSCRICIITSLWSWV